MAKHEHKLEIFRGYLKFKSNVQKIWGVLIFLSIVTAIEVALGILKPPILMNYFLGLKLINWLFIIITIFCMVVNKSCIRSNVMFFSSPDIYIILLPPTYWKRYGWAIIIK